MKKMQNTSLKFISVLEVNQLARPESAVQLWYGKDFESFMSSKLWYGFENFTFTPTSRPTPP